MTYDAIYAEAAVALGTSEAKLRAMALGVVASILLHALKEPGRIITTLAQIRDGRLELEVDAVLGRRVGNSQSPIANSRSQSKDFRRGARGSRSTTSRNLPAPVAPGSGHAADSKSQIANSKEISREAPGRATAVRGAVGAGQGESVAGSGPGSGNPDPERPKGEVRARDASRRLSRPVKPGRALALAGRGAKHARTDAAVDITRRGGVTGEKSKVQGPRSKVA